MNFLAREIEVGSFPSASYAIGTARGAEEVAALGNAVVVPFRIPATADTIYDCASITKPLITTTLVLQAIAEKRIRLEDVYRGYSFFELLTHSSGLEAWLPMYAFEDGLAAIDELGFEGPRGRVVYSDLNFFLLFHALEEVFGDYVEAARTRIFEPLGLQDSYFRPADALKPRIAATEWGQRFEAGMCATRSFRFSGFREGLMWGETNDGNSHHHGGTRGNAGLFATARDVFRIAQGFARGELVPLDLVREATRAQVGDRGLGWQIAENGAYGHTGFTGTSLRVDGERIMVLLTNRVHPCAAPVAMQRIRGEFYRLAHRLIGS